MKDDVNAADFATNKATVRVVGSANLTRANQSGSTLTYSHQHAVGFVVKNLDVDNLSIYINGLHVPNYLYTVSKSGSNSLVTFETSYELDRDDVMVFNGLEEVTPIS